MQKILKSILILAIVYMAIYLVLFPKASISAGQQALSLCANSVVPALLPYLICSGFITKSGCASLLSRYLSPVMRPLFNLPGSASVALVLGSVSGYPIGAVCANDLYKSGECTKAEAERMLAFCNNSGPIFIIAVIACGFLGDASLGKLLYISHILSAVLVGIIMRSLTGRSQSSGKALPPQISASPKNIFFVIGEVMDSAVLSMLKICGFVIFFSVLGSSLPHFKTLPYLYSILEITGGIKGLSMLPLDFSLKLSLISFFTAFSGISVLFQVGAATSDSGLSLTPYFFGKLLQGIFSFIFTKILVSKLPVSINAATKNAVGELFVSPHSVLSSYSAMLLLGVLILFIFLGVSILWHKLHYKKHPYI
jgi:sporulation integral membrane protein YlbJ